MNTRSTTSNVATGSARDHQHHPALVNRNFAHDSRIALQWVYYARQSRQKARQLPNCCKEERWVHMEKRRAAARKNTEWPQLDSQYDECFTRLRTNGPFKDSTSSLLLAEASPLQKEFTSVCIKHTQLPWSSVILTAGNICYSGCLYEYRHPTGICMNHQSQVG
jgi:hypothetical protein